MYISITVSIWTVEDPEGINLRAFCLLLFMVICGLPCMAQTYRCLESGVKETDISDVRIDTTKTGQPITIKITVRDSLKKLKARCVRGKLVDGKGKQIRFYFVHNCWGNPPENYLEILEKQRRDLENLQRQFTVIQMTCNPTAIPPQ